MNGIYDHMTSMVGGTPILRLHKVIDGSKHEFFCKLEAMNPGGSVKDRIALSIVEGAEARGDLKPGGTIVEATSGNTGVGLALVAAVKGYKCIFVMPEKISEEKRAILRAYGARVVMTPMGVEPDDPRSYLSVAKAIAEKTPGSFWTNQFSNPDNPRAHIEGTGPEIWKQMEGNIDVFVGGAGTGGTVSGVGKFLKSKKPDVKIVCADPIGSILHDLFYHGKPLTPAAPYKVEGVGEDMLPDNTDLKIMDAFEQVTDQESMDMTRRLIAEEGVCVGPSSAMALVGAIKYSKKLAKPSKILVMMPDNGRAYLSKVFNDQWMIENGFLKGDVSKAFNRVMPVDQLWAENGWKF